MKTWKQSSLRIDLIDEDRVRKVLDNDKHWVRWDQRSKSLGLPKRYTRAKLEDFNSSMEDMLGKSLYIHGTNGTGKTHLMAALARRQIALGLDTGLPPNTPFAKFISVPELLGRVQATFSNSDTVENIFNEYAKTHWLYLDDFGTEKESDWTYQVLYRIVDYRWGEMLPTVVSSNFSPTEVAEGYCQRMASRLVAAGKAVKLAGKDRRAQ